MSKVNAALVGIFMFGRYNASRADQNTAVMVSNTTGSSGGDLLLCTQTRRVDNQEKIIASSWKVAPDLKVTERWKATVTTNEMLIPQSQQAFYACSFGFWHYDLDNDHNADKFNIQNTKVNIQGFTSFPDFILPSKPTPSGATQKPLHLFGLPLQAISWEQLKISWTL